MTVSLLQYLKIQTDTVLSRLLTMMTQKMWNNASNDNKSITYINNANDVNPTMSQYCQSFDDDWGKYDIAPILLIMQCWRRCTYNIAPTLLINFLITGHAMFKLCLIQFCRIEGNKQHWFRPNVNGFKMKGTYWKVTHITGIKPSYWKQMVSISQWTSSKKIKTDQC